MVNVIILAALVIFLIDLAAVVGMHTNKHSHSASPTTTLAPTTTSSLPATTSTSSSTTLSTVPLTIPVTSPPSSSQTSSPGTSAETTPSVSYQPPPVSVVTTPPTIPVTTEPATTTTTVPPVTSAPPSGSYSYQTGGTAQSTRLGSPTPITVSSAYCGQKLPGEQYEWSPNSTNSVTDIFCLVSGGIDLTSITYAAPPTGGLFFPQLITCPAPGVFLPVGEPRSSQSVECHSSANGSVANATVTVESKQQTALVDGQTVSTIADTVKMVFASGQFETGTITTTFYLTDNALIAAESGQAQITTNSTVNGSASYSYNYSLVLISQTPTG
jgi:hypothetical protein